MKQNISLSNVIITNCNRKEIIENFQFIHQKNVENVISRVK